MTRKAVEQWEKAQKLSKEAVTVITNKYSAEKVIGLHMQIEQLMNECNLRSKQESHTYSYMVGVDSMLMEYKNRNEIITNTSETVKYKTAREAMKDMNGAQLLRVINAIYGRSGDEDFESFYTFDLEDLANEADMTPYKMAEMIIGSKITDENKPIRFDNWGTMETVTVDQLEREALEKKEDAITWLEDNKEKFPDLYADVCAGDYNW